MRTKCGTILAVLLVPFGAMAVEQISPLVLFTAMTGKPGEKEAEEYFDAAQKAGFGQMLIYPRSGLEWEYMSEGWLDFVGACLNEAKSRGMKVWLYDEFNWPSGSCRGRVPKENPAWTYTECAVRKAAKWSRKRFVRDVAVRYPQRLFGRLALGRAAPGEKEPPLCELVTDFSWRQMPFELIQEDEESGLPYVFSFRGREIVEERSGRTFASPEAALDWLRRERRDAWRAVDANSAVVPGLLVRRYEDGTAAVLNMTEQTFVGLSLEKGESGGIERFSLPACGVRLFAEGEPAWTPRHVLGDAACGGWTISFDRPSLRRIWFPTNGVAVLKVSSALSGVRFAVCNYPEVSVRVSLDGKMLAADLPCRSAPYGYAPIYRETEPMELAEGTHELKLEGRADNSVFLPVLWLAGDFAAMENGLLRPVSTSIPRLAPLAAIGHGDFAGVATYRTMVTVPRESGLILALDTGGLPARVRLGGVDLGPRKSLVKRHFER